MEGSMWKLVAYVILNTIGYFVGSFYIFKTTFCPWTWLWFFGRKGCICEFTNRRSSSSMGLSFV
jgi:hypothetical protein